MDKMGKMGTGWKVFLGVFFAMVAIIVLVMIFGGQSQEIQRDDQGNLVQVSSCDSTTTPSLTINAYDIDNVGTADTEATNIYRKKGDIAWTSFTAGTGFTGVSPGDELEIVMGISATDFVDNSYGQMFGYVVPCSETPSIDKAVALDEVEGSVTATFYNADANAAAESFTTGETQTVSIKVRTGSDEYFGNPFLEEKEGLQNLLILHLNTTTWDKPESVYLEDGTELKSTSVPQRFAVEQTLTGRTAYAYKMPVIEDKIMEIFLDLNADDTTAPATDDTAYLYAANYFVNAETGEVEFGIETEENGDVATSDPDSVTLDFT